MFNEVSDIFIDVTFEWCAKFFLEMFNIWPLCSLSFSVAAWKVRQHLPQHVE